MKLQVLLPALSIVLPGNHLTAASRHDTVTDREGDEEYNHAPETNDRGMAHLTNGRARIRNREDLNFNASDGSDETNDSSEMRKEAAIMKKHREALQEREKLKAEAQHKQHRIDAQFQNAFINPRHAVLERDYEFVEPPIQKFGFKSEGKIKDRAEFHDVLEKLVMIKTEKQEEMKLKSMLSKSSANAGQKAQKKN